MKAIRTWILLADSNRARIVENRGPGKGVAQLCQYRFEAETPKGHTDRPGRTFNSVTPTRHKMSGSHPEEIALTQHVDEILSSLNKALSENSFERLIICAPPSTLGAIRKRISGSLKEAVISEIPKDLTRFSDKDLTKHLEDFLAV